MDAGIAIGLRAPAVAASLLACINSANAIDLQWIRTPDREYPADVQTITITGSRISWGAGSWVGDFGEPTTDPTQFNFGLGRNLDHMRNKARVLADVCHNPALSPEAKDTASTDGMESRWLAAQETFNAIQAANQWRWYQIAHGGIRLLIDGKSYTGFKVTYADGASELWVVNPQWSTSTVKLFDTPAPNSITTPTREGC